MIDYEFIQAIIYDGLFAAVAAIGFAIISNPPRKALAISAFLAAVGHGLRYFCYTPKCSQWILPLHHFVQPYPLVCWLFVCQFIHCRQKYSSFPSLLPMIPGMFAYKSILAPHKFMQSTDQTASFNYIEQFFRNGITTFLYCLP